MRRVQTLICSIAWLCMLTACGGGGGGSSIALGSGGSTATTTTATTTSTTGASTTTTVASTTTTTAAAILAPNVQAIVVDSGPDPQNNPVINEVFTSVKICAPAAPTTCQTIDHVLVDTGSSGLRIVSSVLNSAMTTALSAQTSSSANTLAECLPYVNGYGWGPIRSVNFQIASESVSAMPIQIIGDANFSTLVPSACSGIGPAITTVDEFGANGVIGVGLFQQDCGTYCSSNADNAYYYSCTPSSCNASIASVTQQVPNPVTQFATDNNGVIISLPAVAAQGATSVSGTMTFGVGTQSNNAIGSAAVFQMDPVYGQFTTFYNGVSLTASFIDSGSNALYFPNTLNLPLCLNGGFYCPNSPLGLSATMVGINSVSGTIDFTVGNINSSVTTLTKYSAFAPLGAPNTVMSSLSFDWGLPFFFGRNVFVVTENQTINSVSGPFVAY